MSDIPDIPYKGYIIRRIEVMQGGGVFNRAKKTKQTVSFPVPVWIVLNGDGKEVARSLSEKGAIEEVDKLLEKN